MAVAPSAPGQVLAVILARLQKVTTGIPAAEEAPQHLAHEPFVVEHRRVPPVPAIMADEPPGGFEKGLVDREVFQQWFYVTIISIHTLSGENKNSSKDPRSKLRGI